MPWRFAELSHVVDPPKQGETVEDEGDALGTKQRIGVGQMKMEMRPGRVAGEAKRADDLPLPDPLTRSYPHIAGSQMFVEGDLTVPEAERDIIACSLAKRMGRVPGD